MNWTYGGGNHNFVNKRKIGKQGEDIAAHFLMKKGYLILEENTHERWGELDLIAQDPQTNEVVFVEVKLRKTRQFGRPEEGIGRNKLRNLIRAAERWVSKKGGDVAWRVDVVGIEQRNGKIEIRHLENVTQG